MAVHGHESTLGLDDHVVRQPARIEFASDEPDMHQPGKAFLQIVGRRSINAKSCHFMFWSSTSAFANVGKPITALGGFQIAKVAKRFPVLAAA